MNWKFQEMKRGVIDALPVIIAVVAFGGVFGAVAAERGLPLWETVFLTAAVFAGASQFTALQFWDHPLPYVTILLVVVAVNFRHILYSAALGKKLDNFSWPAKILSFFFVSDPTFALAEKRFEEGAKNPDDVGLTAYYFLGASLGIYPVWVVATTLGHIFGGLIENPERYGIDFILPIYFLVLLIGFRARANWFWVVVSSGTAAYLALITLGSPWHISIGALVGITLGAILGGEKEAAA
ncbi:MAG: AzlC family ABC transporter permease [Hyphomicrobiales bacterium]